MTTRTKDAAYWIEKLRLEPHPEGGFYRQTYRADLVLPAESLPPNFAGPRSAATAIYFLLEAGEFSAFHRLRSDELWHFYLGASLLVHVIEDGGSYSKIELGSDPEAGEVFQAVVRAGCWFTSELRINDGEMKDGEMKDGRMKHDEPNDRKPFALVGCTVAPGFDFEDFELAERGRLAAIYPQHRELIDRLTRGPVAGDRLTLGDYPRKDFIRRKM